MVTMRFVARLPVEVLLHDEAGEQIGVADMRRGPWAPADDEQAEALRCALPALGEFGIRELADDEKADPPEQPRHKKTGGHKAGRVTTSK